MNHHRERWLGPADNIAYIKRNFRSINHQTKDVMVQPAPNGAGVLLKMVQASYASRMFTFVYGIPWARHYALNFQL